jgi:hypothetical protein
MISDKILQVLQLATSIIDKVIDIITAIAEKLPF